MAFQRNSTKQWKKSQCQFFWSCSKKIEMEGKLPNSFWDQHYLDSNTKDPTKKENSRPISLMNMDTKLLNKTLANWIQHYIKRIIHHNQVGFIPLLQGWLNIHKSRNKIHHINKRKDKNYMILSIEPEKSIWQNTAFFLDKNPQKVGIAWTSWRPYTKDTTNIILNEEKLRAFLLRSRTRQGCPLWPLLFNIVLEVLASSIR